MDSDEEIRASSGDEGDGDAEELRRKIESALKVDAKDAAMDESEEGSDELMDDEQMMAIDEQLAEVFRSRASEKGTKGWFYFPC